MSNFQDPSFDVDKLWNNIDTSNKNNLDITHAKQFIDRISYAIHPSRSLQYDKDDYIKFKELFDEFDEDKNGYLSRQEMSVFIKIVFKKG